MNTHIGQLVQPMSVKRNLLRNTTQCLLYLHERNENSSAPNGITTRRYNGKDPYTATRHLTRSHVGFGITKKKLFL